MGELFVAGNKMSKFSLIKYSSIAFVCFFVIGWNVYSPLLDATTSGISITIAVVSDLAADGILQPLLQNLITSSSVGLFGVALLFSVFNTVTKVTFKKSLLAFIGYLSIGFVVIAGFIFILRDGVKSRACFTPTPQCALVVDIRDIPLYWSFLLACVVVLFISFVIRKIMFRGSGTATSSN